MKIKTRLDVIQFNGVDHYVNDVLKTLAKLPVDDLVMFLGGSEYYSRRDYATVLKNVMRDEVWKFKLVSRVAEKGLAHDFYSRLDYFDDSPVTVLENLFTKMVKIQPELIDYLLEDLWLFALQAVSGKNNELVALYEKAEKAPTAKIVLAQLFPKISALFKDELGDIDGVLISEFTRKGLNGTTLKELREMGDYFGVSLPTSITKQDIYDGIVRVLPNVAKAKDIPAITEDLSDMTVFELKEFVEKYKLDVPVELKKADVGELLVSGYVNKDAKKVNDRVEFSLPERVDAAPDVGDENPKIMRLNERVRELESALAAKPKEVEKVVVKEVVKEVKDDSSLKKEQNKVAQLEEELAKAKLALEEKPKEIVKEVVKEVPGRTIVRTVVSKKELLRQKEKYEAIIAEQEKERALLISRSDEHDEILAKYAEVKEALARKEAELDEELSKVAEEVVAAPVVKEEKRDEREEREEREERDDYGYAGFGGLHAKMDRLVDKIHEVQLEVIRSENRRLEQALLMRDRYYEEEEPEEEHEEEKADHEVNLFLDSNLAKRIASEGDAKPKKKKRGKKRRHRGRLIWVTLLILIILALIVFVGGWVLQDYHVTPIQNGPLWLINPINAMMLWIHSVINPIFMTIRDWWMTFISWFKKP